MNMVFT